MSKITKNVVIVFTLVCIVVLVVFCVQLFLLNRDNGDNQPDATISNNDTAPPSDAEDTQIADDPFQDGAFNGTPPDETTPEQNQLEGDNQTDEPVGPPENATLHRFPLSADIAELHFYVDTSVFGTENLGESWLFTYTDGEDAWLEVGFAFVQPGVGTRGLAETFLHNYLESDYSTFEGERTIGNSTVRGIFVTGESEGETYDAWLRDLSDLGEDSLALIIVVRYSTDEERNMLFRILDTMSIYMLVEDYPEENGEEA